MWPCHSNIDRWAPLAEGLPDTRILGECLTDPLFVGTAITLYYGSFRDMGYMSLPDDILMHKIEETVDHEARHTWGDEHLSMEDHRTLINYRKEKGIYRLEIVASWALGMSIFTYFGAFFFALKYFLDGEYNP